MIDEKVLGRVTETGFAMIKSKIDAKELLESFRPKQIECKSWLVQEISNVNMNWKKVLVLGSWNSLLLYELMSTHCDVEHFDFLDNNTDCHRDRDIYFEVNNLFKNYSSITMDATKFSDHQSYDLIINTSCEHITQDQYDLWKSGVPHNALLVLQSNNYAIQEHVRTAKDLEEFKQQCNIDVLWAGELALPLYTRYMIIGKK